MKPYRPKKRKVKDKSSLKRRHPYFTTLHQNLIQLDLLKELPAFTTKKYQSCEYFKMFEFASLHNISLKQGCLISQIQQENVPSPEQIMKCCWKISSGQMTNFINKALARQFNILPKSIQQQLLQSGIIFIDFHQDCYYGNQNNPHVRKGRVKKSTKYFYEYLTADIYSKKGSFTIAILHRTPHERIISIIERLLSYIELVFPPKFIIFDGEFANIDVLALLKEKHIKFLARKSRSQKVREHLDKYYTSLNWEQRRKWRSIELRSWRSRNKQVSVDICPQNVNGERKTLVKSHDWLISPQKAELLYKHRFIIESGYRDKHKFQIFTCTKILSTRLLIYLFAILLWNCWQSFIIWMHISQVCANFTSREQLLWLSSTWIRFHLREIVFFLRIKNKLKVVMQNVKKNTRYCKGDGFLLPRKLPKKILKKLFRSYIISKGVTSPRPNGR